MFKYDLGDGADLRILEMRHAKEFLEFVAENRTYLGEWLGWAHTVTTLEAAQGFIRRGITCYGEESTLYEQKIIIVFDWTSWGDEVKRYQAEPEALARANLLTLRKLLTAHIRADRFVEGRLASVLESGHIAAILRRLKQIRDEMIGGTRQYG